MVFKRSYREKDERRALELGPKLGRPHHLVPDLPLTHGRPLGLTRIGIDMLQKYKSCILRVSTYIAMGRR
jgi:hypothetical protein